MGGVELTSAQSFQWPSDLNSASRVLNCLRGVPRPGISSGYALDFDVPSLSQEDFLTVVPVEQERQRLRCGRHRTTPAGR